MIEKNAVVLKWSEDDVCYCFQDSDFPAIDTWRLDLRETEVGVRITEILREDGEVSHILDCETPGLSNVSDVVRDFVFEAMSRVYPLDPERRPDRKAIATAGRNHPAAGGVMMENCVVTRKLSSPISESEISDMADDIIADRTRQDYLKTLPIHACNADNGNRYLKGKVAKVNQHLGTSFPKPDDPNMDLIIEVETSNHDAANIPARLTPVRAFALSQSPRFNLETEKVTGVGASTAPDGTPRHFVDIWDAAVIMKRLPEEDMTREDTRYHLDCALHNLMAGDNCSEST
jgi:hypothetical protein